MFFKGNISQKDILRSKLLPKSAFWKDVLLAWGKLNYMENTPMDKMDHILQNLGRCWNTVHRRPERWQRYHVNIWPVLCKISGEYQLHAVVISAIPRVGEYNRIVTQSFSQTHLIEKLSQSIKPNQVAYTQLVTQTVQFPIPPNREMEARAWWPFARSTCNKQ